MSSATREADAVPGQPVLSIVVPTLNEEHYLPTLMRSLAGQKSPPPFEVIVVDSSADDRTRAAARASWTTPSTLRVISVDRKDIGAQRNVGWEAASAPSILFLDADVWLHPDTLRRLLDVVGGRTNVVASIRHTTANPGLATRVALAAINVAIAVARSAGHPVTNGDFIYTTRWTLQHTGGFREGFLLGEDTDFGIRARRIGAHSAYLWNPPVFASSRRLEQMPALRLAWVWARAYVRALHHGPTPPGVMDYPFGVWRHREDAPQAGPAPRAG